MLDQLKQNKQAKIKVAFLEKGVLKSKLNSVKYNFVRTRVGAAYAVSTLNTLQFTDNAKETKRIQLI